MAPFQGGSMKSMQRNVAQEVIVAVPPAAAWVRLKDLSTAHHYVPGVTNTRIDSQRATGVGARRTVFLKGQAPMQETVVEWNEGSGFVLDLQRGGKAIAPFAKAEFIYEMAPEGHEQTRFRLELRYTLGSALARVLDYLFLSRLLRANVRQTGDNLKRYYETGMPVNREQRR
jgi:carbon monoxide dehydrogenase subunit G